MKNRREAFDKFAPVFHLQFPRALQTSCLEQIRRLPFNPGK
jgi:hypothetical protein